MELTGIFVYPIKGMGGIPLKSAILEERGIRLDRRWMLIDDENRFISQRQSSNLSLFRIEISDQQLKVSWKEEHILIPIAEEDYQPGPPVTVWDDTVENVLLASKTINDWFTKNLGMPCRLAYQSHKGIRMTPTKYAPSQEVSFADGYPYLIISEESLGLLNEKLKAPIDIDRFRANFIIKGGNPHIEDEYNYIKIGEVELQCVKPCARCTVVTINQKNATKSAEPLATLAKYRRKENKILFGQNLILKGKNQGEVKIGDPILFSDKKI